MTASLSPSDRRPAHWSDAFWIAAWFALAAGIAEALLLGFRHVVLHQFIWSSRHIAWMAPTSYLLFFAIPATGVALGTRVVPRLVQPWWIAAACAFVATGSLVRLASLQRIHLAAIAILAAGVAVQVTRLFTSPSGRALAMMRRTTLWLAAAVALVGGATSAWWALAERRAIAGLPAARAGAPNVLLLILDTVRAASLGLYGYRRSTTPELERFARRGVVFDRAISASPWTLPSHAVMFTGRWPHELPTGFLAPLDRTHPTLAEVLQRRGYLTAGFVANAPYAGSATGLSRGFVHYEDYRVTLKQVLFSSELGQWVSEWRSRLILRAWDIKPAPVVNRDFLDWAARADRPFFAFLNYMEAHLPYHATSPANEERFRGSGDSRADRYDAAIATLDEELGRLFRELETRGLLANTIVIVSADHGEQLGEHGLDNHGNSLYLQLLHVPLAIVGGGVPAQRRVAAPVSLHDLHATILSLTGSPDSTPGTGTSLERFWTGDTPAGGPDALLQAEVERHPSGLTVWPNRKGPMRALLRGPYHYIRESDGREQLFDWWVDPAEEHELGATEEGKPLLESLRAALAALHM